MGYEAQSSPEVSNSHHAAKGQDEAQASDREARLQTDVEPCSIQARSHVCMQMQVHVAKENTHTASRCTCLVLRDGEVLYKL